MNTNTQHLLEQFESLSNKVVLYFPDNHSDNIAAAVDRIITIVGGCTVTPGNHGYWKDDTGKLYIDDITLITVFCDDDLIAPLIHLANNIRVEYNQICISLEVNGHLLFIE